MNCFGSKEEVGRSRAGFGDIRKMSQTLQAVHPMGTEAEQVFR